MELTDIIGYAGMTLAAGFAGRLHGQEEAEHHLPFLSTVETAHYCAIVLGNFFVQAHPPVEHFPVRMGAGALSSLAVFLGANLYEHRRKRKQSLQELATLFASPDDRLESTLYKASEHTCKDGPLYVRDGNLGDPILYVVAPQGIAREESAFKNIERSILPLSGQAAELLRKDLTSDKNILIIGGACQCPMDVHIGLAKYFFAAD